MEFQQLRGFYYSARLGNLTKAAEKMAITQSAVSQQIKALEEGLGDRRMGIEGYDESHWILLDYGDVVIHLF